MKLKLSRYELDFKYIPGKFVHVADLLSRNSVIDNTVDTEKSLKDLVHTINMSDSKKKIFQEETRQDETLRCLVKIYRDGWPLGKDRLDKNLVQLWKFKDRVYVPKKLINEMLHVLHASHMGITRTLNRAKQVMFWPEMQKDIENFIAKCRICERNRSRNEKHTIKPISITKVRY